MTDQLDPAQLCRHARHAGRPRCSVVHLRLRLFDGVKLDDLDLDLRRDVRDYRLVEVRVVLFLRIPNLRYAEALRVLERHVQPEARLLLELLHERRRKPIVVVRAKALCAMTNQHSHFDPPLSRCLPGPPLHISELAADRDPVPQTHLNSKKGDRAADSG
jgi:hypothetical protein